MAFGVLPLGLGSLSAGTFIAAFRASSNGSGIESLPLRGEGDLRFSLEDTPYPLPGAFPRFLRLCRENLRSIIENCVVAEQPLAGRTRLWSVCMFGRTQSGNVIRRMVLSPQGR